MNDAHFHLVINHLPIVGVLIGFLVLLVGIFSKKPQVKLTALGILVFSALTSIAAFYTGEGAEEVVENISGINESLIHTHEESAELFFTSMLVLGAVSLLTIFLEVKRHKFSRYGFILALVLSALSIVLAQSVGTSGGEIRHTEIRSEEGLIPAF